MRVNKTKKNLQMVWKLLDDACGSLDNAFTMLGSMSSIPSIKDSVESIDFSAIVNLKNEIEELIEQIDKEE